MGKMALALATATLLLLSVTPSAQAQNANPFPASGQSPASEAANRVIGYTAWDDDYLYLAIQVNKPTLRGNNAAPYSKPLEDDAILISFQTDNDRKTGTRTAKTFTLVVSAFGGFQFYFGAEATPLFNGLDDFQRQYEAALMEKDPGVRELRMNGLMSRIIKKEVVQKGAMRAIGTPASGYTMEIAIPWINLGGRPKSDTTFAFNVVAQSVTADTPRLQSLSPFVKTEADTNNPSRWLQLTLRDAPAPATLEGFTSPRVVGNRPVVDGEFSSGEWNGLASFSFGEVSGGVRSLLEATLAARARPEFKPQAARPAVPFAAPRPQTLPALPRQPQKQTPLVLATYDYAYQADRRKSVPTLNVTQSDGATALAVHPLSGNGPWLSYDRTDWHLTHLQEARRMGVDVLLPIYRGDARSRILYADKGLLVLVTALQHLEQSSQDFPQIGLYLDTTSLEEAPGESVSLEETLYRMIRQFYERIPARFRARIALSAANGGRDACPVFLSHAASCAGLDIAALNRLRTRFATEFEGTDLIFLGESGFLGKLALDGYFQTDRTRGFQLQEGWLKLGTVSAAFDSFRTTEAGDAPKFRSRRNGDAYREDWMSALARKPDWTLIQGWNDYRTGGSVAPTLESGFREADLTRLFTRQFITSARQSVRFVGHDAPRTLFARMTCAVHLRLQNSGTESWGTGNGMAALYLTYRWRRGEQVVASGPAVAVRETTAPGENRLATLSVRAEESLPEGDYTLELIAQTRGKVAGDPVALTLPVQIRKETAGDVPGWAATLVRANLPTMLETGGVYTVEATLRNDGAAPWLRSEGARVSLRLQRTEAGNATAETALSLADATAELTEDVPPGQITRVQLKLPVMEAGGAPLPVWNSTDLWTYTAHWEIAADKLPGVIPVSQGGAAAPRGVRLPSQPVAVLGFDFGARFISDRTLTKLPAQKRQPMVIRVQNRGTQIWKKDQVRIGYHWYYLDGTEFLWEDETTALPADLKPGETTPDLLCYVTAPAYDGAYYLVWDIKVGDTWASTGAATRAYDQTVHRIEVTGDRLTFVDLTKAYNVDGVSDPDMRRDGNFDGQGRSFPADLVPPFADMPVTPAMLWMPATRSGPDSPRRIGFRWGPKDPGEKNFIACQGQRVELGKSAAKCAVLHILAASSGKEAPGSLRLVFEEPGGFSEDQYAFFVSAWDGAPKYGEEVAFLARRHHTASGVENRPVQLYHYTLRIKQPRKLSALMLPKLPDLKIAALTLER
jgi:hypothetical protein